MKRRRKEEGGFTLLELLIGVTIVSILLAISAQSFYMQRRKGWTAQVKSSVRNMAMAENSHVYVGGAQSYSNDLDDLWEQGYRYQSRTVIPHIALATDQTFCIQVNSARDHSIVWHFSSTVGYPQEGPATAATCNDSSGAGIYAARGTGARDGVTSAGIQLASNDPGAPGGSGVARALDPSSATTTTSGATVTTGSTTTTSGGSASTGTTTTGTTGTTTTTTGSTTTTTGSTSPEAGSSSGGSSGSDASTTPGGGGSSGSDKTSSGTSSGGGNRGEANGGGGGNAGACKGHANDPDGDSNGGRDAPGGTGGVDGSDQDCDNGSGNDADGEDDNNGRGPGEKKS